MRIERLRQTFRVEVKLVHFPLHPDTPDEGRTLEELFAGRNVDLAASATRMKGLMAAEGLPYGDRTMTYQSRLAQELGAWADTTDRAGALHDALFRAYFVDGVNIARADELVRIVGDVGLPPEEAQDVLDGRLFRDVVDADWKRSRALGVTGVPTYVVDNRGLVGAQPYEALAEFVVAVGALPRDADKKA